MAGAVASWETDEYNENWGLAAQKASSAYALGFHGQGVKVGQMDSGILKTHSELSGDRWHAVSASGTYTHDGERYPQYAYGSYPKDTHKYYAGENFSLDGYYNSEFNDNHGTGCAGVYAGNRDGLGMHGVAWGSEFYSANTGGTDDSNYGPFPDYGFFKAGYDALVNAGVKIINNSWGTNLKRVDDNGNIVSYYYSGVELSTEKDIEYEYFMFKKNYNEGKTFVDAAWEAVQGKDVIQAFSAGNNYRNSPYHRALYPYFNPDAENQWLAVSGLKQNNKTTDPDNYQLESSFNEAGFAKWWTLSAPGQNGRTSNISGGYGSYSGTSMATPFVSGAFAVLASRYPDMSAVQVRQVLLTTANHKNSDGTNMEGWENVDGTPLAEGEVSDRMGWGVPDLEKGMYGLGQLFGHFDYGLQEGHLDVWSNDISQVALDQREREDLQWLDGAMDENGDVVISANADDYKLTDSSTGEANPDGQPHDYDLAGIADKTVTLEEAQKWRLEYYEKRIASINDKIENGLYNGSLTKSGTGTLVMTGNNTYRGGTVVEDGALYGFNHSFGVTGDDGTATANGKVTVNGGVFGVINSYDDTFTMKGSLSTNADAGHSVDITVNKGGTYALAAGQDVSVGTLTFNEGAGLTITALDRDVLAAAMNGETITGSLTAEKLEGAENAAPNPDYAFFTTDITVDNNKLTATMSRNESAATDYAVGASQAAVASTIVAAADSALMSDLALSTKDAFRSTIASLGSDLHLTMQEATMMSSASMVRTIKDIAADFGVAKTAELDNGVRLWAAGTGAWMSLDGGSADADTDTYTGYIGADYLYGNDNKLGIFFGYGSTNLDAGLAGKIDSNDLHFGIYGQNNWDYVGLGYGLIYTTQDRDGDRTLTVGADSLRNQVSYDADVTQLFVEASYRGLSNESFSVEPYAGLGYMHVSADSFTEHVGNYAFKTEFDDQDVWTFNLGVRGKKNFTVGDARMAVKGDVAWMQFFGDNQGTARMTIADAGTAQLEGDELNGLGVVSLGIETEIGKSATLGVSYTGAFGSDVTSHGVGATVKILF